MFTRPEAAARTTGMAALLLGTAALAAPALSQDRPAAPLAIALVIGNTAYAALPRLPGCELSAGLAAASLSRAGFRVSQQSDPSNARMGAAIAALGDEAAATPGARAVIYYCGHVASLGDRVFLLPVQARLERDGDVLAVGIVARLLVSSVAAPDGAAGLVLMDVGARPGTDAAAPFASMVRPGDAAHAGVAVAQVRPGGDAVPGPLASALADMLRADASIATALSGLSDPSSPLRARMLMVSLPRAPSWLVPPAAPAPVAEPPAAAAVPVVLVPAVPIPAAPVLATPGAADRRQLQLALQRLGYFRGRVTGAFGFDTMAAIRRFQSELNEDATGRLTQAHVPANPFATEAQAIRIKKPTAAA